MCSIKNLFFFILLLLILSCNDNNDKAPVNYSTPQTKRKITIDLQPFENFPEEYTQSIYKKLKNIYSSIEIKSSITFPENSLNLSKTRHRADSLINFLSKKTIDGHLTIGLTIKDISTTKNNIQDWGIMGLGFCPGKSCIASTYRLDKTKTLTQLFKVAIHELGHTEGLQHCPVKTCYMRDAEGKNTTDEEKEFCLNCKKKLIELGWDLK